MLQPYSERLNPIAAQWLKDGTASEAAALYRDLIRGLSPIFGLGGVGLMFARSLKLTSNRFPFLEDVFTLDGTEAMADRLHLTLSLQDPGTAAETCSVLFSTFMSLLETFLGLALASRLLNGIRHGDTEPEESAA